MVRRLFKLRGDVPWGGPGRSSCRCCSAFLASACGCGRHCLMRMLARDRQLLQQCVGPPLPTQANDLGVQQEVGRRCKGHFATDRAAGAAERLQRYGSLAAGFAQRLRVTGTVGRPAARSGKGQIVWPMRLCPCSCVPLVVFADVGAALSVVMGGVAGHQTAPVAEVAVALLVAEGGCRLPPLTECEHVCRGASGSDRPCWRALMATCARACWHAHAMGARPLGPPPEGPQPAGLAAQSHRR